MLKGREVIERLKGSECHQKVRDVLVHLAEDNSQLKQENLMLAEAIDSMASVVMMLVNNQEAVAKTADRIRKGRTIGVDSEAVDPVNDLVIDPKAFK